MLLEQLLSKLKTFVIKPSRFAPDTQFLFSLFLSCQISWLFTFSERGGIENNPGIYP